LSLGALNTGGRLAVFAREPDGTLGRSWQAAPNGTWLRWEQLGVKLRGAPAAIQNVDGRVELFGLGEDGKLGNMWQGHDPGGWWSEWSELGPRLRCDPVVTQNADGRLEVFAIGPDGLVGHMWQMEEEHAGWSSWSELGPTIRGVPSVFQNTDGRLEVFAIGPDGLLGHAWQQRDEGGWSAWEDLGPAIAGDPVVFQNGHTLLEVFAVGPDGRLGHMWQREHEQGGWADWETIGPETANELAVFQNTDGRLEVFAAGPDGLLGHIWQGPGVGGWADWAAMGPAIRGAPAVFQNANGRLELFACGPDGFLGHIWQTEPGMWSGWELLGPEIAEGGLAVCHAGERGLLSREPLTRAQRRATSNWPLLLRGTVTADICVIGAGPAGVTVSDELVRAGASVIMLESGGWEQNVIANELNRGIAEGPVIKGYRRYLMSGRNRQVQGAASMWGRGRCMPFRELDFEERGWIPHSGWPISKAELSPYEAMAAYRFGFAPFGPPVVQGPLARVPYRFPSDSQLFRQTFLELLARPRFRAELGVTALELHGNGERIESLRCGRIAGGELRVTAGRYVLAGGAIENARLLLLNEHALPASDGLIGRYFMEHPHVLAGTVGLPDGRPLRSFLGGERDLDVFTLADGVQAHERLGAASVELRPISEVAADGSVDVELYVRAEQVPDPESRVTLGDRLDRYRCRQPMLDWRVAEDDWHTVVRTAALVADAMREQYGASVRLAIDAEHPWPWEPGGPTDTHYATWGYHFMGTTRMADDPAEGVVDRNCLVHGMSNLYVTGGSVFPTGGYANPTFMIVAMAHRLAEHMTAG
jgi:hypothetical protein